MEEESIFVANCTEAITEVKTYKKELDLLSLWLKENNFKNIKVEYIDIGPIQTGEINIHANRKEFLCHEVTKNTSLSCGQKAFSKLPDNDDIKYLSELLGNDINNVRIFYSKLFETIKLMTNAQFIIASNRQDDDYSIINDIMLLNSRWSTPFLENPNSGNNICMWII